MAPFASTGYARGRYNPGGSRKSIGTYGRKKYSRTSRTRKTTRRTYKRKSGLKSSKKNYKLGSLYNTIIKNQLQVYRYPFSTATKYPKIPDNKVDLTIGLPFNYSRRITVPTSRLIFWLYPGITDCASVYAVADDGAVTHVSNGHFIQHCLPYIQGDGVQDVVKYDLTGYGKYRYVSCGMRVGTDNLYLQTEGTWQACRVPLAVVNERLNINLTQGADNFHFMGVINPVYAFDKNDPTYQTGALKELGNYEFRLFDSCREHEFIQIPNRVELNTGQFRIAPDNQMNDIAADGVDLKQTWSYLADNQWDCICLELKFSNPGEMISYHTSANVELVPNDRGNFWHFATECVKGGTKAFKRVQKLVEKYHRLPGIFNANKNSKVKKSIQY